MKFFAGTMVSAREWRGHCRITICDKPDLKGMRVHINKEDIDIIIQELLQAKEILDKT